ncbi:MAG: class I SAM-dependent methyltransferase [Actinomycetota bacterium]|nr:class I SAM-dependent methyltransferase [Actinomycetota bacterium]
MPTSQSNSGICRSCNASVEFLLDFGNQPIVNNLQVEPGDVPKFPIEVGGCSYCGLVQILNPIDPAEFYTNYANASSVKREPHLERLIEKLESLLPKNAKIIDVGCNDGKFLSRLRESGFNDLHGLEPTKNMSERAINAGFGVFNSYLDSAKSREIVAETGLFDCVTLRQVLEHIENLSDFGVALRSLLKPNGLLVIEVPDAQSHFDLPDFALWEEHINDFSLGSLKHFLRQHGLEVIDSYKTQFSGVCLTVLSRLVDTRSVDVEPVSQIVDSFRKWAKCFDPFRSQVQAELQYFASRDLPIALYGVGSRSSFFLNVTRSMGNISFAIDDDPAKQGKYLPGTDILIRSREDGFKLLKENSLVLLGVNGENEKKLLSEISPQNKWVFKSILPPSENLLSAFNL